MVDILATVNDTNRSDMAAAILNGDCPFCGKGGYKSIAGHIQGAHGIKTRSLRDALHLTYTESICSKELSGELSKINVGKDPSKMGNPNAGVRVYSEAGAKIRNHNLKPPIENGVSRDTLRENGRIAGLSRKGTVPWNKSYDHGRRAMYRRGCRCDECTKANSLHWAGINERRRPSSEATSGNNEAQCDQTQS